MANFILYLLVDTFLLNLCFAARRIVLPQTTTTTTTTTSETQTPWYRTIYSTQVEIVTPTVIAGVTFSAKPPANTNHLQPWISLDANGSPKTIKPEIKKGHTIRASPDYSTYFKTAVTKTWSHEELKASNMDPGEEYEEVIYLDEDDTYVSLNPIIRCTPERYFKMGPAKERSSEPFCTPKENREWTVGKTYFLTWYTQFFKDDEDNVADQVRVHLSYFRESSSDKNHKRALPSTFLSSEWIKNVDGLYAITIDEEWLHGDYRSNVLISLQPNTISDDDFDPFLNGLMVSIIQGVKVYRNAHHNFIEGGHLTHQAWLYIVLTTPFMVVIALVVMYLFLRFNNRRYGDFSNVKRMATSKKHKILGKFKDMKRFKNMRNSRYDELPQHNKTSKQS